jgi:superfamily II DNA or RNA helicase
MLIQAPDVPDLIREGHLVPTRIYAPDRPDLTGVRTARGDYVESQLGEVMNKPKLVGNVVEHWHRLASGKPTVAFATGVKHSVSLRDEFRRSGVAAEHIDGSTLAEDRDRILDGLARGTVDVVTNAMVLTEGWDCPSVSCLVLARPTKFLGLYRQMVGRVLRPAPGKADALILDHAGAVFEHGLPEDPIEWTLDAEARAENPVQRARRAGVMPTLAECPECHAVRQGGQPCVVCGWKPVTRAKAVEVADGNLARIDGAGNIHPKVPSIAEQRHWHAMLAYIAQEKGRKSGWVSHKFKEKFGKWPIGYVAPELPSPEVRAWVRSRDIAYAKAMEKRRAG